MKITLKDGKIIEAESGISAADLAKAISENLLRNAVCVKIDGQLKDLTEIIGKDCLFEVVTFDDDDGKNVYRHTASHVLAQAVKSIFPTVKLAIGPAIDNGFYYDFDFVTKINTEDLEKIQAEMNKIIKANLPIEKFTVSKTDAAKGAKKAGADYKLELINGLPDGSEVTFYRQGDFIEMCRGPHLSSTGKIKAFKLTGIAGAYWRGDEKNKMLTRIYGTAFTKKADMDEYLNMLEEAKKRDHNKLGRELEIFMTDENIGQGLPLLMPKGAKILQILQRFVEDEEERRGYLLTKTPLMAKNNLYKISGHWYHYKDKMFVLGNEETDDEIFALRPMTCPFQYSIYNNGLKSYRDLPKRYAETATLFRNEASGEMHGLIRVRQFTLSDGHIVCAPEQLEEEFKEVMDLIYYLLDCLGLTDGVSFRFSRYDKNDKEKYIDDPIAWERAESVLKNIIDGMGIKYTEAIGEAAFYGPKLDIQYKNVHGKEDTIITVQIDFAMAEKFEMSYIDENGDKKTPYIIHRSSIGCYERTLAMLIEKYAGALPLWMCPEHVRVMSLTDRTADNVKEIKKRLNREGILASLDIRNEKIGYKIREAQLEKIPYMVIIGDKEAENGVISVRSRSGGDLGTSTLDDFITEIKKTIQSKAVKN
ncbi:MAG: threonine--tRNA ligase [Clostridiales bacterium]|jgi:threonyl-tRNA synthetase|nr:threonine--tRNA ligase [Clostridiales bacterium]